MDLNEVNMNVQNAVLNSAKFPYRTGQLRNNFFDFSSIVSGGDVARVDILTSPLVRYGKILEDRASIKYRTKNHFIYHKNKHFRYIDRIIETDVVDMLKTEYGVRLIDES